jgi:hypothetical protein
MAKYCPMCKSYTNCTDNCISCMEEEHDHEDDNEFYNDLLMEQQEQM